VRRREASSPLLIEFGARVRAARQRLAISQEELAHRSGLDRTYISGVERGLCNVALVNLSRLAEALGTDPGVLVAGLQRAPDKA
jgi:transcriptional regulator with XRE-family HTH domain